MNRLRALFGALFLLMAAAPPPPAAALDDCLACHGLHGFADGMRSLWVHPERFGESVHHRLACPDCHKGVAAFPHGAGLSVRCDLPCHAPGVSHEPAVRAVGGSVHARLAAPPCLGCHAGVAAPAKGERDALCAGCHAGLDRKAAIYPDAAGAVARRAHDKLPHPPGCADCHGVHGTAKGAEAAKACASGGCHPGAAPSFGELFTHGAQQDGASPAPWGLPPASAQALAALLAALLLAHCLRTPGAADPADEGRRPVEVLDPADRGIHLLAAVGALGALASGPVLRMPGLFGGSFAAHAAPIVHALASVLLLLAFSLHLARTVLQWLGGQAPWGLAPRPADLSDLARGLGWSLGLGGRPRMGRFSYRERLGYGALMAALPLLALTGFAVALPGRSIGLMGAGGLAAAAALHAGLGYLCFLALAWHLFFAAGQPGALGGLLPAFTGKISWRRLRRTRPDWAGELDPSGPAPEEEEGRTDEAAVSAAVEALLAEGNRLSRENRHAEAAEIYGKALEIYPGYAQALFNLGVTRLKLGDAGGARDALNRYLAEDAFGAASGRARELLAGLEASPNGGKEGGDA